LDPAEVGKEDVITFLDSRNVGGEWVKRERIPDGKWFSTFIPEAKIETSGKIPLFQFLMIFSQRIQNIALCLDFTKYIG